MCQLFRCKAPTYSAFLAKLSKDMFQWIKSSIFVTILTLIRQCFGLVPLLNKSEKMAPILVKMTICMILHTYGINNYHGFTMQLIIICQQRSPIILASDFALNSICLHNRFVTSLCYHKNGRCFVDISSYMPMRPLCQKITACIYD